MIFVYVFIGFASFSFVVASAVYIASWLHQKFNSIWCGLIFLTVFYGLILGLGVQYIHNYSNKIKENKVENVVDKCEK